MIAYNKIQRQYYVYRGGRVNTEKELNELAELVQDNLDPEYMKQLRDTLRILDELSFEDKPGAYRIVEMDHTQCRREMTYTPE